MSKQCAGIVYVRDTYRRTGRGPHGFSMHYRRQRCSRRVKAGTAYCWQHQNAARPATGERGGREGE